MDINSVNVSGNLTRDSEIRVTPSGKAVLSFSIAVNESHKNAKGEWEETANFVDVAKFFADTKPAEYWHQRLVKGTHVMVSGKLRFSSWDKDGQRHSKLEIIAGPLDSPNPVSKQPQQGQYQQPNYSAPQQQPAPEDFYDEDMPF